MRHVVASLVTLRRYDTKRPVVLYCPEAHRELLAAHNLTGLFSRVELLPREHQSIVGFKLHLHRFKPFERSLYVDADMIWCRSPDKLWAQLSPYSFTATGYERADPYFGGPKDLTVIWEFLRDRRRSTLEKFQLTHLPRVQAGMIFAQDAEVTRQVCETASAFLAQSSQTHFRSRSLEGRTEESCEWSMAMAMSKLKLPVYPWMLNYDSPQLDYIKELTTHTEDFEDVSCKYYCDRFVYDIRGLSNPKTRNFCFWLAIKILRRPDYLIATPFTLHFSWMHEKAPFNHFADRTWERLTASTSGSSDSR